MHFIQRKKNKKFSTLNLFLQPNKTKKFLNRNLQFGGFEIQYAKNKLSFVRAYLDGGNVILLTTDFVPKTNKF